MLQYSQRHTCNMINHCDRCITLLSDNDISFGLFNLFPFFICLLGDSNTLNAKEILKIYLIEQKIYPNHQDEWYILSQWFTKMYHAISLTVLYMFILCIELHVQVPVLSEKLNEYGILIV
jgi:hypothetical protein